MSLATSISRLRVVPVPSRGVSFVASRSSRFSGPPGASGCQFGLVQLADLLLDSESQALDWFYGLSPSCATHQRAERTR
jgi:hypothetical protein